MNEWEDDKFNECEDTIALRDALAGRAGSGGEFGVNASTALEEVNLGGGLRGRHLVASETGHHGIH